MTSTRAEDALAKAVWVENREIELHSSSVDNKTAYTRAPKTKRPNAFCTWTCRVGSMSLKPFIHLDNTRHPSA